MRLFILSYCLLISLNALASNYPEAPDALLTPGVLCQKATELRYPEKISYCKRDVDSHKKWDVISAYMAKIPDFNVNNENRNEYKIDHYIPLCMGGSNDVENLWPQHQSVYRYTDNLELNICKELELGEITQAIAIAKIKFAKNHLEKIKEAEAPLIYVNENYNK